MQCLEMCHIEGVQSIVVCEFIFSTLINLCSPFVKSCKTDLADLNKQACDTVI